jgi:epsilon-lactone hydrolase
VNETDAELAVAGESAGGGLAVALLALVRAEPAMRLPVAAAIMSPWVDLTLSGATYFSRAAADPIFTQEALRALAEKYLQGHSPEDSRASPLWADLQGLPPLRIDVGDDEVLLDDALRLAERANLAGVVVKGAVWAGMPHVFQANVRLRAAQRALDAAGNFLEASWRVR